VAVMAIARYFVFILGALALNVGGSALSADAKARHCTTEECACERALEQNTVEALEAFLKKYPHSVENGDSACGALAVPPGDDGIVPEGQSHEDSGMPEGSDLAPAEG
jgi:hypothetical protein